MIWLLPLLPLLAAGSYDSWSLVLLEGHKRRRGARCLDGTAPGYYLEKGYGDGASRWIVHFQGGAWCVSFEDCLRRSKTSLGSSREWAAQKDMVLQEKAHGMMSNDSQVNPDFYNWNKVYVLYCDGSSLNSEVAKPIQVKKDVVYLRGHRILQATMESLLETMLGPGYPHPTDLMVCGCSAGGLSTWLHLDYIRGVLPADVHVVGIPQSGLFMDQENLQGTQVLSSWFKSMFHFMGMSKSPSLNRGCLMQYSSEPWRCVMPQYVMPFIKTPFFAVNSFYDQWQMMTTLGLPQDCIDDQTKCTKKQQRSQRVLRDSMVITMKQAAELQSYFLHSCVSHCQYMNHDVGFRTLHVANSSLQAALRSWYFQRENFHGDSDWEKPNQNPTCWLGDVREFPEFIT